ncbi:MAG TPA: helix-turn-helix domain-containing protein [Puia sp.]|nr:helix-turn-helix domain-containing protein [Puia sp.]
MKHRMSPFTSFCYIWEECSAVFYSSSLTPFHSHNTLQLVFDIQNHFRFRLENGQWQKYKTLIIRENTVHQLDTNQSVQLIIYLDAQSTFSRAIKSTILLDKVIYAPDLNIYQLASSVDIEKALIQPEADIMKKLVQKILSEISQKMASPLPDKRIAMVEQIICTSDPTEFSIKILAEKVFLSESRLRSLFKKVTGITIHQYILYNKIKSATSQLMAGKTVSDAAFEGGFSDSSHLHKMMVRVFGISPSDFLQKNKQKQYLICDPNRLHFRTHVHH